MKKKPSNGEKHTTTVLSKIFTLLFRRYQIRTQRPFFLCVLLFVCGGGGGVGGVPPIKTNRPKCKGSNHGKPMIIG